MTYYLFKEYYGGSEALFSTRHEAEIFASKYIYYMESCDTEVNDSDYDIIELELNPSFDKWWSVNG